MTEPETQPSSPPPAEKPASESEGLRRRFSEALLDLETSPDDEKRLQALVRIVNILRPDSPERLDVTLRNLSALTLMVQAEDGARQSLRDAILWLLAHKRPVRLLSDSGILAQEGFFSGLWRRTTERILPPVVLPTEKDPEQLKDIVNLLFRRRWDHEWLAAVPEDAWIHFLDALEFDAEASAAAAIRMRLRSLEALQVLSHRIAAMGLDPELVRNHPAIEQFESPFLSQSSELSQFVAERHLAAAEKRAPDGDDKHLLVLLEQCEDIVDTVRRKVEHHGASITLTALLVRLQQSIERMRALLELLEPGPAHERNLRQLRLFLQLVRAENQRLSLREHCSKHLDLLSRRITSHAGEAGEQYITQNRKEYFALFRSAAGAGFLVAIMAAVKLWMAKSQHAPLVEAIEYSLNYVIGFVLMYLFHFSLATKQPAMTASRIAHSMDTEVKGKRSLAGLSDLIVRTIRSQFVAVAGNIAVAVPLALLIAYLYLWLDGGPNVSAYKAEKMLDEANPFHIRTWFWASLTGVWLFVSGLISGYFDNKAIYARIPKRVRQLRWLERLIGEVRMRKLAWYLRHHLGGLMGTIAFGVLLGSTAAIGRILGLPLDTLHVTFVSANTTYAWVALDLQLGAAVVGLFLGILIIGLLNLLVSFGLAMVVALKSRQVQFADAGELMGLLWQHLRARPIEFLWPPRDRPDTPSAEDRPGDEGRPTAAPRKTPH